MLNFMLPKQLKLTLVPTLNRETQQIEIQYQIIDEPLADRIKSIALGALGKVNFDHFEITRDKIIYTPPEHAFPYKFSELEMSEITITLQKV